MSEQDDFIDNVSVMMAKLLKNCNKQKKRLYV